MIKSKDWATFVVSAAVFAMLPVSVSAQDSLLGSTSTDRVELTASIEPLVLINTLPATYDIGSLAPGAGNYISPATALAFCVYSNTPGSTYEMTATGGVASDGTNGSFALVGGSTLGEIEYQVDVDDEPSFGTSVGSLVNGSATAVGPLVGQGTDPACGGGANGSIQLTIVETEIIEAAPDTYTDTLVLTVAPL